MANTHRYHPSVGEEIAALKSQTQGIEVALTRLGEQVQGLANQFNNARTPNYLLQASIAVAIVTVLGFIGNLALSPIKESQADQRQIFIHFFDDYRSHIEKLEDDKVGQRQHRDLVENITDRLAHIETNISTINANIVPRGENKEHWDGESREIETVRGQLEGLKKDFSNIYSAGNAIDHLQKEIDAIESRLTSRADANAAQPPLLIQPPAPVKTP